MSVIRWRRPGPDGGEQISDVLGVLEEHDAGSFTVRTSGGQLIVIPGCSTATAGTRWPGEDSRLGAPHAGTPPAPRGLSASITLRNHVNVTPSCSAFELIAHRDRRETVNEPSTSRMRNCQRCPGAITSQHVLGRHSGHVGRLSQGHLPLVQIASIGRALSWVHRAGRFVRAEHRAAPTAWTPPSPTSWMVVGGPWRPVLRGGRPGSSSSASRRRAPGPGGLRAWPARRCPAPAPAR